MGAPQRALHLNIYISTSTRGNKIFCYDRLGRAGPNKTRGIVKAMRVWGIFIVAYAANKTAHCRQHI